MKIENIQVSEGLNIENGIVISLGNCADYEIVIPNIYANYQITIIGRYAFEYSDILSVILPETITTIKENAFYQCSKIKNIHFGTNVTTIEKKAFFKCTELETVRLPHSLTTLEEYAFASCYSLKSIYIGNSITKLEMSVFENCEQLNDIYFDGTIAEWNAIESATFPGREKGNYEGEVRNTYWQWSNEMYEWMWIGPVW